MKRTRSQRFRLSRVACLDFRLSAAIVPDFFSVYPTEPGAAINGASVINPHQRQGDREGCFMLSGFLLSALLVQTATARIDGGVVAGTLRQPDGSPAAGVRVAAMTAEETADAGNASTLVVLAQTDAAGRYRLEDVPPGRYYIVAGRVNAPSFYPGGQDVRSGKVITVAPGATSDGIDFQATAESLRPAPPSRRGGLANLNQSLQLLRDTLNQARPQSPMPGVPIRIRVVLDEDSKNANLPANLTLEVQRSGSVVVMAIPAAAAAGDGRSTVNLQPGESKISVIGLPRGYSVRSITSGNTDLMAGPVGVFQGMPEIIIVVSTVARI